MKKTILSNDDERVFAFVAGYVADKGFAPTLDEITDGFADRKPNGYSREWVRQRLTALEAAGRIAVEPRKWRGITIIEKRPK